ncbi:MAG: phosphate ABC transporter substrate-binding protein [Oscillospiraceae bacterium]|nr:phosphate ABC transporter substrate-binding protein [Oscillospiraceae bacterium]
MRAARARAVRLAVSALILLVMLMPGCGGRAGSHAHVIVAGSTSVQPYAEILAEEYARMHPGSEVDVQGGGSSAGIAAAESDTADIGMSSRKLKEGEAYLWSVEIAKDGLAVIVHPDNPVSGLTLEQVRDIYSGEITDWAELDESNTEPIDTKKSKTKINLIAREAGSGTRSAFLELVMGDEKITPKAIIQSSNGAIKLLVSGDKNAIGFISLGLVDESVKALMLNGVEATTENVINGGYSLFRPFLYVCNGEPTGAVREFIDFTLSAEGQRILAHEGLIPADTTGALSEDSNQEAEVAG